MFDLLSLENCGNVHIVSTGDLPPDTAYFTLSHRWGDPPSIILSKETSFLLAEDISPYLLRSSEAVTFQHAIHVTRALGFRYLWIDALCITQDDELERTEEIMHMDDIYFNCTLNISATEAQIHKGLIFDRDLLTTNPCRFTVTIPESQDVAHLEVFPESSYYRLRDAPLAKRAWVFQERTLAPRIVHFARDQAFWECRSLVVSEIAPQGVPGELDNWPEKGVGLTSGPCDIEQVRLRWHKLVGAYSRTSATFATDHLLAISAVAKRYGLAMHLDPSDYVAGMWKGHLPLAMLWVQIDLPGRRGPEPTSIGLETQHAPSWSWPSILAPIQNINLPSLKPIAQVMSIQVARLSPNYFDGTISCRLSIRGAICKFRRLLQDGVCWIQVAQQTCFRELDKSEFGYMGISMFWDTSRCLAADDFFLLHVASRATDVLQQERGLILRRTGERATYARAGAFFILVKHGYPGSLLEDAFEGRLDTLDTDDYFEIDEGGRYTIDIV